MRHFGWKTALDCWMVSGLFLLVTIDSARFALLFSSGGVVADATLFCVYNSTFEKPIIKVS